MDKLITGKNKEKLKSLFSYSVNVVVWMSNEARLG